MPGTSSGAGIDHTDVADTTLVSNVGCSDHQETDTDSCKGGSANESQGGESPPDQPRDVESSHMVSTRRYLATEGISEEASKLILSSWRSSTEGAYSSCWQRWEKRCTEHGYESICLQFWSSSCQSSCWVSSNEQSTSIDPQSQ